MRRRVESANSFRVSTAVATWTSDGSSICVLTHLAYYADRFFHDMRPPGTEVPGGT